MKGNALPQLWPSVLVSHISSTRLGLPAESQEMQHIIGNFQKASPDWHLWLWQALLAVMTGQVKKALFPGRDTCRACHCRSPDKRAFREGPTAPTRAPNWVRSGANCLLLTESITFCCSQFFRLSRIKAAKDFICIQGDIFLHPWTAE